MKKVLRGKVTRERLVQSEWEETGLGTFLPQCDFLNLPKGMLSSLPICIGWVVPHCLAGWPVLFMQHEEKICQSCLLSSGLAAGPSYRDLVYGSDAISWLHW